MSIGKISASGLSVTNENTAALVNVNIDFSLLRCDPSPEYSKVGLALTGKRKHEAENGALHSIACKLGYLFHEMLPNTPKLHRAYGIRLSEILSHPGINPEGTKNDGPFRDFVGADCTSIWAAATSGPASISMLFLACMLARVWDAKKATSIWVELIDERKKQILAQVDANKIVHPFSLSASRQDISRPDLASWDASARSWLRRADAATVARATQLHLLEKNLSIPYWSSGSLFERVTMNWIRSMEMLENLLSNVPQEASTRAVLIAISSWHLYPDILAFQDKARKIPFSDELFPKSGILSTGLEYKGPINNVTQWSLSLSHFRYYGDPVIVRSDNNTVRVPACKLWVVALGVIFRQWEVSYSKFDEAVAWFRVLGNVLAQSTKANCTELSWLVQLCEAASTVWTDNHIDDGGLIKYGWRRAKDFLGHDTNAMRTPFFGLCNPYVMSSLTMPHEIDCGIEYLRGIASHLGLEPHEAVASFSSTLDQEATYNEWTTISPIDAHLGLRGVAASTDNASEKTHIRWLSPHCQEANSAQNTIVEERQRQILDIGEQCHIFHVNDLFDRLKERGYRYCWIEPPALFGDTKTVELTCLDSFQLHNIKFHLWVVSSKYHAMGPVYFKQKVQAAESKVTLEGSVSWLKHKALPQRVVQHFIASLKNVPQYSQPPRIGIKRKAPMDETIKFQKFLCQVFDRDRSCFPLFGPIEADEADDMTSCFRLMSRKCNPSTDWLMSLRTLELVTHLYDDFDAATVSLRILDRNISKAKWLPKIIQGGMSREGAATTPVTKYLADMSLAETFSCIAMYESGYLDIDPDQMNQVLALCSEDSMFVASIMLSDPGTSATNKVRHLIGNVGHSGMVLMVPPMEPRIRAVGHNPELVAHRPFDSNNTDSFGGTSLHLSFTTWKMPLDWEDTGAIDQSIFIVESVVSVQDNGRWVADIDVLDMVKNCPDVVEKFLCDQDCETVLLNYAQDIVSIDTWEEFLDPPPCAAVFRARDNWAARLAAASILVQQSRGHAAVIIQGGQLCLSCLHSLYSDPEPHFPQIILN